MPKLSMSDKQMISELEKGREWLLSKPSLLLSSLRRKLHSVIRNIYVLHTTPAQSDELYRVLVDGTTIVHIEIPRDPKKGEVVFEKWSVKEYLNGPETRPKGIYRRKFLMALKLAGVEQRA